MDAYKTCYEEQISTGCTHCVRIYESDLTQATANVGQLLTIFPLKIGDVVTRVFTKLVVPFQDTADAAFNSTLISVGDNSTPSLFITPQELNVNGTEVFYRGTNTLSAYNLANAVTVTFNAMAAKSLVNLNRGELHVFLDIRELADKS